ncbi:MAG TPA: homoserine dehydrogenase [Candidatus Acidoferrales bacterium]|nr:homoserine dehydrogenase [Candidatus Acidoferrales bacterium]
MSSKKSSEICEVKLNGAEVSAPVIVLKFGSSVVRSEQDLPKAVHEIYRWVRQGYRVVSVISAIGSATNQLIAQAESYGERLNEHAVAALVSTGEAQAAALLGLALDRSGIPATIVDDARLGLLARGPVLDAEPVTLDAAVLSRSLQNFPVVVAPGFVGRHENGGICLLGRGGSDLTAVLISHSLRARCRLIKDVDGVFEADPLRRGSVRRYRELNYNEALKVAGRVVQRKAIQYAQEHSCAIEVASLDSHSPTEICALPSRFYHDDQPNRALRVGLLGAGTVGLGVYHRLALREDLFEITGVAVRRLKRDDDIARHLLTQDPWEVVRGECEVVVELIGGLEPARELIEGALRLSKHVITANKLVISKHGPELHEIAKANGVSLQYSAAVGGAVPMLETVARVAQSERLTSIHGVVNGTTNFVLDRIAAGSAPEEALKEAQRLGFAEQDPSSDLDGRDAAHKLVLLAREAFGAWIRPEQVECTGITELEPAYIRDSARSGRVVRLVGKIFRQGDAVRAVVAPEAVDASSPLAGTRNEENCLVIHGAQGAIDQVRGKGAGRWPTAESVVADVFDLCRAERASAELQVSAARLM